MSILSRSGVHPDMAFRCCDCGDKITGKEIIQGVYLYIVQANREHPEASVFRCECCQDDYDDTRQD